MKFSICPRMVTIRRILSILLLTRVCLTSSFSLGKVLAFSPRLTRSQRLVVPPVGTIQVSPVSLHVHSTPTERFTSNTVIGRESVEAEAENLKQSIIRWLDAEYTPHPLNNQFGKKVAIIYTRQLLNGDVDLISIHQQLQDTLGKIELKDIVIDAEDVADKVCELIIARFDRGEDVKKDVGKHKRSSTTLILYSIRSFVFILLQTSSPIWTTVSSTCELISTGTSSSVTVWKVPSSIDNTIY